MFEQEIAVLAKAIREAVTEYKADNRVPLRRDVRVRRRDLSLKYQEDFAFANFNSERTEEDSWDWEDQTRFGDSVLSGLQEYKSLLTALKVDSGHADSVDRFARSVASASFQNASDQEITGHVDALARDLGDLPTRVIVTAFIDGVSISESPIVVSDFVTLRRPTPEDLAEYVALDEHGGFTFPKGDTWFRVVGDFAFDVMGTGLAQDRLVRMIEALRLFRVGSVSAPRFSMVLEHSFRQPGGATLFSPGGRPSHQVYKVSPPDAPILDKFLRDIAPLLPGLFPALILGKVATEKEIAYLRYNDALFQNHLPEQVITSAVTALEALFLTNESELRYRLAQRVAVFLRFLGTQTDAGNTYETVSKGYGIRSTFVHGGSLKPKERRRAQELAPVLLEYARASVLAFFQMAAPKAELLKQLDRAMIDPAGAKGLEESLEPVVHK